MEIVKEHAARQSCSQLCFVYSEGMAGNWHGLM